MFAKFNQLIRDEIEHPFSQPMDLIHLAALMFIIGAIAVLWFRVLVHIERAGSAVISSI